MFETSFIRKVRSCENEPRGVKVLCVSLKFSLVTAFLLLLCSYEGTQISSAKCP